MPSLPGHGTVSSTGPESRQAVQHGCAASPRPTRRGSSGRTLDQLSNRSEYSTAPPSPTSLRIQGCRRTSRRKTRPVEAGGPAASSCGSPFGRECARLGHGRHRRNCHPHGPLRATVRGVAQPDSRTDSGDPDHSRVAGGNAGRSRSVYGILPAMMRFPRGYKIIGDRRFRRCVQQP